MIRFCLTNPVNSKKNLKLTKFCNLLLQALLLLKWVFLLLKKQNENQGTVYPQQHITLLVVIQK